MSSQNLAQHNIRIEITASPQDLLSLEAMEKKWNKIQNQADKATPAQCVGCSLAKTELGKYKSPVVMMDIIFVRKICSFDGKVRQPICVKEFEVKDLADESYFKPPIVSHDVPTTLADCW